MKITLSVFNIIRKSIKLWKKQRRYQHLQYIMDRTILIVLPYGMKNSTATFQRIMNEVISDLDGCEIYIEYSGHEVGQGSAERKGAKMQAIAKYHLTPSLLFINAYSSICHS